LRSSKEGIAALTANGHKNGRERPTRSSSCSARTGAFTCSDVSDDTNNALGVALADVDGQNGPDAVFANQDH
jgi:hypothetical protein